MSETLETLVDDILAVVFDDRGPDTPASIAATEFAERLLNKETSRADFVRTIARLIIVVNAELRHREELKWEAEARAIRARCARDPVPARRPAQATANPPAPIMRQWRVNPLLDLMVDRQSDRTATLMGDPAPGRSALDQRQGGTQ